MRDKAQKRHNTEGGDTIADYIRADTTLPAYLPYPRFLLKMEISQTAKRLYEDNVSGKISDERFMELSADYEQEQRELKDRAAALQEELSKSQAATVNAEKFMGIVRKHLAFEELTPTLLREMIEKIVVHECSYDENGTRRQDIEIYYSFVGKIDLPEA